MIISPPSIRKRRTGRSVKAGALALTLLLLFEFAVARTKWAYELTPGIFIDSIYALEDNVIDPGPVPVVAVFGSSRLQDAVAPRLLERELGLKEGEAVNLAFPFGDAVGSRLLYERSRSKLSQVDVAVVGVEMWDLFGEQRLDPLQEYFLPMAERLEHTGKDRVSLIISSFWKTYAMRGMAGYVFGGLLRGGPEQGPLGADGRMRYYGGESYDGPESIDAAIQFDDRFAELEKQGDLSGFGDQEELQRFIDMLTADGVAVVVVHLPMRRDFIPEVENRLPKITTETRRVLDELTGPTRVDMEVSLEALGLPDTSYRDFGHAAEAGVIPLTHYVASLIGAVSGS